MSMRRIAAISVSASLLIFGIAATGNAQPRAGTACSKATPAGKTVARNGVTLRCTKTKAGNVWRRVGAPAPSARPGRYINYSAAQVAATPGTKILFFHADWCSQCRKLDQDIRANTVPRGVTIFKVDYDSNRDLRRRYGVVIQTTLVKVDSGGKMTARYVAYEAPTLNNVTKALLK
jgi:thiol-disulfide isomerase/thioredoxin